jgi:hypothetical protein
VKIDTDSIGRCESDCLTITTMKPHVTTFVLSKYGTKYDPIIGLFVVFIIKAKRRERKLQGLNLIAEIMGLNMIAEIMGLNMIAEIMGLNMIAEIIYGYL